MLVLPSWKPFFEGPVRMHGRALQLADAVTRLEPAEDELLRAEVKDDDAIHTLTIEAEGKQASAECTCDHFATGAYCKHIWAALLELDANEDGPGNLTVNDLTKLRLSAPKARKRDDSARPVRAAEPKWMGRLSLLRPSSEEADNGEAVNVFPTQRQICYVIIPHLCRRHSGLVIDLQQRTAIASGWSKPKPLKISLDTIDTLADPVDRELVSMLLGATWVTPHESGQGFRLERNHATYRVATGAQRSLLKRMIATGRCFFELLEDDTGQSSKQRPLKWAGDGNPWKLWLIAHQAVDGLVVDLQLRRAGKRLPISEPAVILGGRDGVAITERPIDADSRRLDMAVAAPFDDRDAIRWVNQFRDHRYLDEGDEALQDAVPDASVSPSALRIATDDIPKFLERLYLLPQLPELDLPDGMGREEHLIEPVPHLDVYSPGTGPAAELVSGSTRNSLVGQVWFDYAGQRINPTQRGRFVPVAPTKPTPDATPTTPATADVAASASPSESADIDGSPNADVTAVVVDTESDDEAIAIAVEAPPEVSPQTSEDEAVEADEQPVEEADDDATAQAPADLTPAADQRLIRRDLRGEREAIAATAGLGLRHTASATGDVVLISPKQMPRAVASLLAQNWVISADQAIVRAAGPPALSITSGIDWFELRGTVSYSQADGEQQEFTLPQILAAARTGQHMITLGDGSQALLPQQWLEDHGLLTALGEIEGDHLRFKSSQAAVLDAMLNDRELVHIDDKFAEARHRLKQFAGIEPLDAAKDFGGELRTYQREGLGWLSFLRHFGMGGILADDMGLGKTVQVLAMLHGRLVGDKNHMDPKASSNGKAKAATDFSLDRSHKKPSLIVVPRSVIFNWLDEAQKFTPEMKVLAYSGPERGPLLEQFSQYDLIVTSYGLMRRDIDELREKQFDYVVLDEAQAIKNPSSQSAKAARLLKAEHHLALTGTPIENHLGDLWSIFEFLNPGMLGANAKFSELVRGTGTGATAKLEQPVDSQGQTVTPDSEEAGQLTISEDDEQQEKVDTLTQVATALKPFILRRTKQQVLKDLPAKTEQTIICEMEPAQRKIYDELRTYYRGTLMQQLDAPAPGSSNGADGSEDDSAAAGGGGVGRSAFMVLEALLRLRQAACHPALITKEGIPGVSDATQKAPSAKLDQLVDMLAEVIDGGQKALVFSQFTSMLSLVRGRLDELNIPYAYLDGQTRNRKEVVEQFQEDPELQVFLISLKAGGVGLNLTAAEYVFILDPWWNPAVEAQAIDRTHRIGQTKPVFAYRMICEDTVEQRIIELQQRKRKLADAIVGGQQNLLQSLTRDDIEQLLS
jgi:superfamily II DNA or RNA helicase